MYTTERHLEITTKLKISAMERSNDYQFILRMLASNQESFKYYSKILKICIHFHDFNVHLPFFLFTDDPPSHLHLCQQFFHSTVMLCKSEGRQREVIVDFGIRPAATLPCVLWVWTPNSGAFQRNPKIWTWHVLCLEERYFLSDRLSLWSAVWDSGLSLFCCPT